MTMTPLERVITAINNTAEVKDIAGDQCGVLGRRPFFAVVNPEEVARAVLTAIREPSENVAAAGGRELAYPNGGVKATRRAGEVWEVMIDALLAEEGWQVRKVGPGEKFMSITEIDPPV